MVSEAIEKMQAMERFEQWGKSLLGNLAGSVKSGTALPTTSQRPHFNQSSPQNPYSQVQDPSQPKNTSSYGAPPTQQHPEAYTQGFADYDPLNMDMFSTQT